MSLASRIASSIPARVMLACRGLLRAEHMAGMAPAPARHSQPLPESPTFAQEVAAAGGFSGWLERRRKNDRQFVEMALGSLPALRTAAPDAVRTAMQVATAVRGHVFALLGSGPFEPVDPDRPARSDGYRPIDRALDPVRGLRVPLGCAHGDWNLLEMRPGNADIKYPWELGRCQHLLALGQAHLLARCEDGGEEADGFAIELLAQCEDFIAANPVGTGVNWTCTMDVALRAANWCLALALVKDCAALPRDRLEAVYGHLHQTGLFIVCNLEDKYEVTSNHFLSNLVGLHILAGEFADLDFGRAWDGFARKRLEEEIVLQVLDDGADYESSIPYHRLVTELFLGSWRLSQLQGRPLSDGYRARLIRMVDFLAATLKPDGRIPVIGDADDGRLMIPGRYGRWDPRDGRQLLCAAALALGQPRWLAWA